MLSRQEGWLLVETEFNPEKAHHSETVFTIGNGYLGTRGAFEEKYPGEMRATFLHGVFDDAPVVFTELANTPDWTELDITLDGERFNLAEGSLIAFERALDLKTATLRRSLRWRSPRGKVTRLVFERFASLANEHLLAARVTATPENYSGKVEISAGLNGEADNLGLKHWLWLEQGFRGPSAWLRCQTRASGVELAAAFTFEVKKGEETARLKKWAVYNHPCLSSATQAQAGESVTATRFTVYYTSRDLKKPLAACRKDLAAVEWEAAWQAHCQAWEREWEAGDVLIEGDPEAQLALRFSLFQLLIAAPRRDERVNLGAKTLSGYGYRGHAFWDTEIFMLPYFTYTRPDIAHNLLSYRWHNLPGARKKALENGFAGAQYPWESAATGEEATPTWVVSPNSRTELIRIWTGDIEIHISADIAFAIWQYWRATGDDAFMVKRGADIVFETALFWRARAEWQADTQRYELNDVIGPDEYHDHVDNNVYTNAFTRWNLQAALELAGWMEQNAPAEWKKLKTRLQLDAAEFERWQHVIDHIYLPLDPKTGLVEQFEGYFEREDILLSSMEPRSESAQQILGIEEVCKTQILKQPDVLMLMYLMPDLYNEAVVRANYDYYTPRTDFNFGSSLGPSIQSILSCKLGDPMAYDYFMMAARADLFDVRGNAGDGIHGASAGGLWQAVVFGFAGLERTAEGWAAHPHLPKAWKRLSFQIMDQGKPVRFDLKA